MRFERVAATAFGPFVDESLEFAPGMTVIWGPNEAGKSTWHAALYTGLCGIRRGRGKPGKEDEEFRNRHRPWDGDGWELSAVVSLADGRRILLRHDLDGRANCHAEDVEFGRDYTGEIVSDGSPDGSRWLGLDRRSFLATACVRQADLLGILRDPSLLQEHLQRAADTAGVDATAASALKRLREFQREQVGEDRSNSSRPLRQAINRVEAARTAASRAHSDHDSYLSLVEQANGLGEQAGLKGRELAVARAKAAREEAGERLRREIGALAEARGAAWPFVLGAGLLFVGMFSFVLVNPAVGVGLVAAGLAALGRELFKRSDRRRLRLEEELRRTLSALAVQEDRAEEAERRRTSAGRAELEALLDGLTLSDLGEEGARRRDYADHLTETVDPEALRAFSAQGNLQSQLERLQIAAADAATAYAGALGQAQERARTLPNVADAEEALAGAEAELQRVRQLDEVLRLTTGFLEHAQERVHRNIAPVLAASIRNALPVVTSNRYLDARVDPKTLNVQVCGQRGRWRDAANLSHGTAEQVYLLLRVALADHLTRPGELCPLLLDEVTIQSDAERTEGILGLLHALSERRQVILFSQEPEVLVWAGQNLKEPMDRLLRLDGPAAAA